MSDAADGLAAASVRRSWRRTVLWLFGVALALAALAYLAVPPVAKHYTQKTLTELLGREVVIDRVLINPFSLTVELGGFRLMEADGRAEALAFDALRANLELESVMRGGPVLHELALVAPKLSLALDEGGRHNWIDVAERLAALASDDSEQADKPGAVFSVGNIRIIDGSVTLADAPRGLSHTLTDIQLGVPFLSNMPVRVDVFVQPSLSAVLNGDPLLLSARSKPFSDSHETVLDVVLKGFDVAPWLPYLPFEPRFRLPSALLTTNLEVSFSQLPGEQPVLAVRGPIQFDQLTVQDRDGAPLASIAELELELADVQPLIGRWHFTRLRLNQPEIDLVRLKDGGFNVLGLVPAPVAATAPAAARAPAPSQPAGDAPATAAPQAKPATMDFLLALVRVREGVVRFEDRGFAEPYRLRIEAINLDVRDLATDGTLPAEIRLDYQTDAGEKFTHEDRLSLKPFMFEGLLNFEALQLKRHAPYLAMSLPGADLRGGEVSGSLRYRVTTGAAGEPLVAVTAESLSARAFELALKGSKDAAIKVPSLDLREAVIDPATSRVKVASLGVQGASVAMVRLRNGDIDLMGLLGKPAPATSRGAAAARAKEPEAWVVSVDKFGLQGASLRIEDRSVGRPVVTTLDSIDFELDGFSTAKGSASQFKLDSRLNKRGRVGVSGSVVAEPLKADLRLDLRSVDLLPLQPYVLEQTKIAISRGNLTTQGRLNLQTGRDGQLLASFRGDLGVANFASVDRLNATDFVRWRTLRVGGINARLSPFSLAVQRVALDDFYTRLILDEEGRLNLREIGGAAGGEGTGGAPAASAAAGQPVVRADAAAAPVTAEAVAPPPGPPPPPVRIDRIELKRGNIAFSDRFVQPNYDANLTDIAGELLGLSTAQDTIATLNLSGHVDKTAPLTIVGELNPFRQDAHLDILASVKDFELTGLSSYAGKYVGYGIARGKLSAELNYKISDRKLTATNQIFLDQLSFGDKVDSPDAVNLPVQLAVSLLKNGRGEIDLHLPVSGTLDDPQFSVFGLVVKMLFNLIGKAITSPFALLGSMVGGGEELSHLEIAPGVAQLDEAQRAKLLALSKALLDRPALRLDIIGRADPALDVDGLRQAALERSVRAQKLKALIAAGQDAPSVDEIEYSAAEYPELLKKAYRAAEFKKPRNLVGMTKDLPVAEMEALMREHVSAGEAELRLLAQQRAQGVREWLISEGEVPGERVFVLEPKVESAAEVGQVQFSLR